MKHIAKHCFYYKTLCCSSYFWKVVTSRVLMSVTSIFSIQMLSDIALNQMHCSTMKHIAKHGFYYKTLYGCSYFCMAAGLQIIWCQLLPSWILAYLQNKLKFVWFQQNSNVIGYNFESNNWFNNKTYCPTGLLNKFFIRLQFIL
jgi:hypothetical protein